MSLRDHLEQNLDRVFTATKTLAENTKDSFIRVSHFVYATITGNNIISQIIIDELNGASNLDNMMAELMQQYQSESDKLLGTSTDSNYPLFSKIIQSTINNLISRLEAGHLLLIETLFLELYNNDDPSLVILKKYGITQTFLKERIEESRMASNVNMSDEEETDLGFKPKKKSSSKTPFLDDFGRDLTEMAAKNQLDPVYNRNEESERVAQVLARRKKNNPVLIGDPGCVLGSTKIRIKKIADVNGHNIIFR